MKNIIKLGLTLGLFAAVSCALLAVVNNWTAPIIAAASSGKTSGGLKVVFSDADSFEAVSGFEKNIDGTEINEVYSALKGGEKIGTVVKATGATYDKSTILVGIDSNKKITGVIFLECSDTPGFGQNAASESYTTSKGTTFYGQFAGLDGSKDLKLGADFEAVSGATITSTGVETMINNVLSLAR